MSERKFSTDGDDCCGHEFCPYCGGSGWTYTITTPCDGCGCDEEVAHGPRPIWRVDGLGEVLCDDCAGRGHRATT